MTLLTFLTLSIFLIAFVVSIISKCQEADKNRTHFWPFARKCQKCQKCQCEFSYILHGSIRKVRIVRILRNLTFLSANFYVGGNNRERIFYLSKITKNDSKILISFTKDAKETKLHVYKNARETMRLWDYWDFIMETIPSQNERISGSKVSLQIFTIFQHLWYRHPMVTFGMIAKCTTIDCGCGAVSTRHL